LRWYGTGRSDVAPRDPTPDGDPTPRPAAATTTYIPALYKNAGAL